MFSSVYSRLRSIFAGVTAGFAQSLGLGLILIALAVQFASLVWAVVSPLGPVGDWRPASVTQVPAYLSGDTQFDPFFRLQSAAPSQAAVTSLSLKLFGVRIDSAMGRGSAIIATPDGIQSSFAVGDEVVPGVKLKSVAFDSVTIDRSGVEEQLFLDQSVAAPIAQPGTPAPISATGVVGPAANVSGLQSLIEAAPRMSGNSITGLTLTPKGDGAGFNRAGLQSGDVLTAVNGKPISSISDISQIAPAGDGNVLLTVERAGRSMTVSAKANP